MITEIFCVEYLWEQPIPPWTVHGEEDSESKARLQPSVGRTKQTAKDARDETSGEEKKVLGFVDAGRVYTAPYA